MADEGLTPRQRAGRENQRKSQGLTPEGREALRLTALKNKPWDHSTGPRTAEGKARSCQNAYKDGRTIRRQRIRKLGAEIKGLVLLIASLSDDDIRILLRNSRR